VIAYLDASVLLRIVLRQRDSLRDFARIDLGVSSNLTEVECLRTVDKLRLRGELSDTEVSATRAALLDRFANRVIVDLAPAILHRAAQPMPTSLNTLDALHLATALLWGESTGERPTMATHDAALGIAARAHGLPVAGI
jgi:predicted nucleic acid-binding protein